MKLSIIIPAYNEEKRIGRTLEHYCRFFAEKKQNKELKDFEILVVINNTKDRTEDIVRHHMKACRQLRYLNFRQGGKGFAVLEGFKSALKKDFDMIGFVDADMATPPEAFFYLVKKINNHDGVIASRYLQGSKLIPPVTFRRLVVGRIFNAFIRVLLFMPYRDTQCGAKLFKRHALEKTIPSLGMSRWAFDVDLLFSLRKKGFKIKEVPTLWIDREYSKINFMKASPLMALAIIRLRLLNSPLKKFVKIYDKIINFIRKFS